MDFVTRILRGLLRRPVPRLRCNADVWRAGVRELSARTGGQRESGAFLLGTDDAGTRTIKEFLFYDDVDSHCFDNGIVEFNGRLLGKVWSVCRARGLSIVADVHVHPGGHRQSPSDINNPIVAEAGHIALILPQFARGACLPGTIGIYEYCGSRQWKIHSPAATSFFEVYS